MNNYKEKLSLKFSTRVPYVLFGTGYYMCTKTGCVEHRKFRSFICRRAKDALMLLKYFRHVIKGPDHLQARRDYWKSTPRY